MARSLFLKGEKVAVSSLLWLLIVTSSYAQSPSSQNITLNVHAMRLEAVIHSLAKQSGYDFLYSKNIVDVSRLVSINVKNKPINEALAMIERQVNVSFRIHDRHIVIKSNPKPVIIQQREKQVATTETKPVSEPAEDLLLTSNSTTVPEKVFESQATQLENKLNKRILELQQLLGVNVPHNIPTYYVNRINIDNRYNGWYASIGTYVSDNSSGLEFQGGLKYLYGVFNPRWAADHGFYGAYGLGNSLQLNGHFSINTMYIYSGYTDTQIIHYYRTGMPDIPDRQTEIKRHHQVKLGLRYSFNENLSLRAGPVFNYQNSIKESSYQPPVHFSKNWVGWDISLQYRVNFYKRSQ